jgi:outer membrane immunogenic protein
MREHSDMGAIRGGVVALAVLIGSTAATDPAAADGGRGPPSFDRPYYPGIWQGLYGGVHLGYGWSGDAEGFVGGGQVGYNWQSQQFVYGIEADISLSDISVSERLVGPGVVIKATGSIDWLATIRGRVGVLVQPSLLLYATAGLGIVNAEVHGSVNVIGLGQISARESDTETGFVYGIGVENKFSERVSWRLEYLGFGHVDTVGDFGIVRAGLNFKFGP